MAKAAAADLGMPLYRYVGGVFARTLPVPMMNIVNGGKHADNPIDIQEFMIQPVAARHAWPTRCAWARRSSHTLKKGLHDAGHNTNVGDEGGFAPNLKSADEALAFIAAPARRPATGRARTSPSRSICAATEFFKDGKYDLEGEGKTLDADGMVALPGRPVRPLPDRLDRGWLRRGRLGRLEAADRARSAAKLQLVGDDLFVTNPERLRRGIERGIGQRDPDQGQPDRHAVRDAGGGRDRAPRRLHCVMSHRSGETEDATIADLAVATNCGQIKTGSLARSDRTAKYNQLIRIEAELGPAARYAGRTDAAGLN